MDIETSVHPKTSSFTSQTSVNDLCPVYIERKNGKRTVHIAKDLNKPHSTVHDLAKKIDEYGTFDNHNSAKGRYKKGATKLSDKQKVLIRK